VGGNAELKNITGVEVVDTVGLSHRAAGDGGVLSRNGLVSLAHRNRGGYCRRDQQHCHGGDATTSRPHSAAVRADVCTRQHVLGNSAYGHSDLSYALPQLRIGLIHLTHLA
jgi:hypothetical protein